jgi:membrane protein DedA with SNARE-associated domain
VSLHEVTHLVHQYGYALVFAAAALQAVGAPVPGGTAVVAAALYAASSHGLSIVGVIVAAALGALIGSCTGFALGRWRGEPLLLFIGRRLRQTPEQVNELRTAFAAGGTLLLFVGRFITGVRNVTGLLAGASGMPFRRFLPVTAAAASVWALINGLEYYFFGHAVIAADTWLQILLVCVGIASLVVSLTLLRRRLTKQVMAIRGPER